LSASFDFSRIILDAAENFGGLIHQVESASAGGEHRRANKIQYALIYANGRPSEWRVVVMIAWPEADAHLVHLARYAILIRA
jgi:hypothetical protein